MISPWRPLFIALVILAAMTVVAGVLSALMALRAEGEWYPAMIARLSTFLTAFYALGVICGCSFSFALGIRIGQRMQSQHHLE
jgi:hypothetical protein